MHIHLFISCLSDIIENAFEEFLKHMLKDDVLTDLLKNQTGINDMKNTTTANVTDMG